MSNLMRLDECCCIELSSVDKKSKPNEQKVKLCNFTDVYYNWNIYPSMVNEFLEATASDKNIDTLSLKRNDVVITKDSETRDDIGMSALIYNDLPNTVLGYHCALIRPKNIINGGYLNAYLNSNLGRKHFENQASGSGQRYTLTKESIGSIKIPIISTELQISISNFFSNIDRKIAINNKTIKILESLAKTIYNYWFLQFEFPNEEGKPYKSSGGKMVWNEELKREIPDGWEVENLAENNLTNFIKPGVNKFKVKEYLATGNVDGTKISVGDFVTYENRESRANMQPKINSVWFAKMKNSVKQIFINKEMTHILNDTILSTGFCGLSCNNNSFEYISCFIMNPYFEERKNSLAHGATQEAINNEDLKSISILIPNKEIINEFHKLTKNIFSKISICTEQNWQLALLRDWLLPMLMNGQVTFKEDVHE